MGVIIAYKPTIEHQKNWVNFNLKQLDHLIIIDNTPTNYIDNYNFIEELNNEKITVIRNNKNLGIGQALNQAVEIVSKFDVEYILTLDQDTVLLDNVIINVLELIKDKKTTISLSDSKIIDKPLLIEVKYAITSGFIVPASIFEKHKFRAEFFMDQIDFDFSYNIRKDGYKIFVYNEKSIIHNMGEKIPGSNKRLESPNRVYYLVRNSTILLIEHKITIISYIYQITYWVTKGLFFQKKYPRKAYLKSTISGFYDAIKGNLGYNPDFSL